jgi:hypothetical protein
VPGDALVSQPQRRSPRRRERRRGQGRRPRRTGEGIPSAGTILEERLVSSLLQFFERGGVLVSGHRRRRESGRRWYATSCREKALVAGISGVVAVAGIIFFSHDAVCRVVLLEVEQGSTSRLHEGDNDSGVRMRCGILKSELDKQSSMLWFGGYPPDVTEGFPTASNDSVSLS